MKESSNPLGMASLILGIVAAALVFAVGLVALVTWRSGGLHGVAVPLFVCGGSSAFLGLIGALIGLAGLFAGRPRGTAIVGLGLSLMGICLFLAFLQLRVR